jgi:hypothetical protein
LYWLAHEAIAAMLGREKLTNKWVHMRCLGGEGCLPIQFSYKVCHFRELSHLCNNHGLQGEDERSLRVYLPQLA